MPPLANNQKWIRLGPGAIGGTSMEESWRKCGPGVRNSRARFPALDTASNTRPSKVQFFNSRHLSEYLGRNTTGTATAEQRKTGFDVDT